MDTSKITNIEVEGINYNDAPDFCDAYICGATWEDGTELTDDELDELNEDSSFVYECVMSELY